MGVPGPGGVPSLGLGVYLVAGVVPGLGGIPGPGGCTWSWGCTCPGTPPVKRMTDKCKNITLPQTSFAGGEDEAV